MLRTQKISSAFIAAIFVLAFSGCVVEMSVPQKMLPPEQSLLIGRELKSGNVTLVSALVASPNGNDVAIGCYGGAVHIIEAHSWKTTKILEGQALSIDALEFSPNGEVLASIDSGDLTKRSSVRLWDTTQWREIRTIQTSDLSPEKNGMAGRGRPSIAFSPDGKILFWTSPEISRFGSLLLVAYAVASGERAEIELDRPCTGPAIPFVTPDGLRLLAGGFLWKIQTTPKLQFTKIKSFQADVFDPKLQLGYSIHEQIFGVLDSMIARNQVIIVRDLSNNHLQSNWCFDNDSGPDLSIPNIPMTLSPNGRLLLVIAKHGNVLVINTISHRVVANLGAGGPNAAIFSSDGQRIVAAGTEVSVWKTSLIPP